jgi:hypothetical protein
VLLGQAIDL